MTVLFDPQSFQHFSTDGESNAIREFSKSDWVCSLAAFGNEDILKTLFLDEVKFCYNTKPEICPEGLAEK